MIQRNFTTSISIDLLNLVQTFITQRQRSVSLRRHTVAFTGLTTSSSFRPFGIDSTNNRESLPIAGRRRKYSQRQLSVANSEGLEVGKDTLGDTGENWSLCTGTPSFQSGAGS
jgi:hypothetical protein